MNEVFADTSGWANAFVKTEDYHTEALTLVKQWQQSNRRVVTTNYVLSEFITLFRRLRVQRATGLNYIKNIRSSTWVEIVHIDQSLDEKAWQLLASRLDKQWSLVDSASFVIMEDRGMTEALTTDHHFEQSGFVRLLK
jgi:predicted nucleic acid-binding protein